METAAFKSSPKFMFKLVGVLVALAGCGGEWNEVPPDQADSNKASQELSGCNLISQPEFTYSPLSSWSSEFGRSVAYGYGDREACAQACQAWFGPGSVAPNRRWDHRGMQFYDEAFTVWSTITNDFGTANAICTAQLWNPSAWSVTSPDPWQCPVLRAQEQKHYNTVCGVNGCRKEYSYSSYSSQGTYACDSDLLMRRWLTNIN